ncbi:metallophosphoesterase [Sneathiella glossodoripedis]|uniref:metallophosphoesterase n=1 Tax=Sneathiella glossodoripedis TaxID=418853 RepID=UPI00046F2CBD|nr:metallophosphoesterase [Sneathiella glossodoripedis]
MLRLFTQEKIPVKLPSGTRVTAIGDIHGQLTRLTRLMEKVDKLRQEQPVKSDYVIFMGDFVDRGPKSAEIIDYLVQRRKKAKKQGKHKEIFLQGNHEELLLDSLNENDKRQDLWWRNGGQQTVNSYLKFQNIELTDDVDMLHRITLLRQHFPEKHLKFLSKLKDLYQVGPLVFVHAGLRMEHPLNKQVSSDLRWIRDPFLNWKGQKKDFMVVHGHSITKGFKPEILKHRIGIDTGSYKTKGRITAAIFQKNTVKFLASGTKKDFKQNKFSD